MCSVSKKKETKIIEAFNLLFLFCFEREIILLGKTVCGEENKCAVEFVEPGMSTETELIGFGGATGASEDKFGVCGIVAKPEGIVNPVGIVTEVVPILETWGIVEFVNCVVTTFA